MKLKITNFKGIYTNENEVNLPSEYCRSTTAKITPIGLEAIVSKPVDTSYTFNNKTLLYASEIVLDEDFKKTEIVDSEFKNTYVYDPEYYFCFIIGDKLDDNNVVKFINCELLLFQDKVEVNRFSLEGEFIRAINHKGRFYFITTEKSYELGRYNRVTNRYLDKLIPPNYTESGILLTETLPSFSQTEIPTLNIERIYDDTQTETKITLIIGEEGGVNIAEGSYYYLKVYLVDEDSNILNTIFFNTAIFTKRFEEGNESEYINKEFFPQANTKNYRVVDLADMYAVGISGAGNWNAILEDITIAVKYNNLEQIKSILSGREAKYKSNIEINENTGFSNTLFETYYMQSFLLDDNTEVPLNEDKLANISGITSNPYHIYKIIPSYIYDLSTKVIAHRIYIKNKKDDPYELIYEKSFYTEDEQKQYYTINDLSGIYSTQTMGLNNPFEYEIITKFQDFVLVNGVFFVLARNNVYYPIIGNGSITKLYYNINVIPEVNGELLTNINNSLAVSSKERTQIVFTTTEDGQFVFRLKEEIGFRIKDKYDIIETADGNFIHTNNGIYLTNGTELRLISEPINDIVKSQWSISNIAYDEENKELWYIIGGGFNSYVYSFDTNTWILAKYGSDIKRIFIANNEKKYLVNSQSIKELSDYPEDVLYNGLLTSLGYMGYLKTITDISFDFKGKITYWDGKENKILESNERDVKIGYIRLKSRTPKEYESWSFTLHSGTVLYGIEVNFELNPKINEYRS